MPLKISRHTSYCSKYWPRTSRCCRASFCDALAPFFSVEYYLISCYSQHYYSVPSPLTSDTMMRQWRCSFYAQDYCVYLSVCGSRPHILMVMVFGEWPGLVRGWGCSMGLFSKVETAHVQISQHTPHTRG